MSYKGCFLACSGICVRSSRTHLFRFFWGFPILGFGPRLLLFRSTSVCPFLDLVDVSDIFYFFFPGEGNWESGGRARGRERVCREFFLGGGQIFFSAPNFPPSRTECTVLTSVSIHPVLRGLHQLHRWKEEHCARTSHHKPDPVCGGKLAPLVSLSLSLSFACMQARRIDILVCFASRETIWHQPVLSYNDPIMRCVILRSHGS